MTMMFETQLPALITLLTVLLVFWAMALVGRARGKYKINAPATTGHPEFELAFRAHQNTLENVIMFLPALWLFAQPVAFGPLWAGVIGAVWLAGRVWYLLAYASGGNRGPGFVIALIANAVLVLGALFGVLRAMFA
jgi:hypothetical protein